MRKILIYTMTVLSLMAFCSCNKSEDKLNVGFKPVTEGDIEASWEGGTYTFEYTLENATQSIVEPTCQEDWISGWITGEYGKVTFKVAENPSEEERTAEVRLDYEDQYIEFKVHQEGRAVGGNEYFRIEFVEVTTSSITAKITPADMEMTYVAMSSDMESMAGFEDDALLFEDALNYYRRMAESFNVSLSYVMEDFLKTGVYEDAISNLDPGTEYCLFVIGMSVQGEEATMLAPIARAYVTTKSVDKVDVYLTIDVETEYLGDGKSQAKVRVLTDNTDIKYFPALLTQEDYDIYGAAMPDAAVGYLRNFLITQTLGGVTLDQIYEYYAYNTVYEKTYECDPKARYWMTAFAVDESMNIISEVFCKDFQAAGLNSDNKIVLEVKDVTAVSADIASTVTNSDPYWVGVATTESLRDWDDEYLMWSFVDYYDLAKYTITGSQSSILFEDLKPGTEYTALAFGFDEGSYTTGLTRKQFATDPAGDPSKCTFDIQLSNLKSRSVDVTVVPSDPSVSYHWDMFEGDMTEDDIKAWFQETMEYQIAMGLISSAKEYWEWTVVNDVDGYSWTTLTPESEYQVIAVAIDLEKADYAGPFTVKSFKTPEAVLSDATVTLDAKYYNGDDLYSIDAGQFSSCIGKALVDVNASLSASVEHYYYTIFSYQEGNEDPEIFTDEDVIHNLVDNDKGVVDTQRQQWLLEWDMNYILIGIAVDANGNYGNSYRLRITPTKDGASPAEDYPMTRSETPVKIPSDGMQVIQPVYMSK